MNNQNNEMVRYGYSLGNNNSPQRKDALFTFRDGDLIFFGISRCNLKVGDKFDRELGKEIAKGRARKAHEFYVNGNNGRISPETYQFLALDRGYCHVNKIKKLLAYFDNLHVR